MAGCVQGWSRAQAREARPSLGRASLGVCAQAKEMLEGAGFAKGGQAVVLGGATIAGFFASVCSLPFDFVKTRIQKMEPGPDGKFPYKGPLDCAVKPRAQEGPLKFYTGFPTYCVRGAPDVRLCPLNAVHVRACPGRGRRAPRRRRRQLCAGPAGAVRSACIRQSVRVHVASSGADDGLRAEWSSSPKPGVCGAVEHFAHSAFGLCQSRAGRHLTARACAPGLRRTSPSRW